jgi:hypothetical protein
MEPKVGMTRRVFSREFKVEAVRLVKSAYKIDPRLDWAPGSGQGRT